MFTQCPQCQTIFRVTATMLKAARGKVRCGRCAHVFNALTFLLESDEVSAPASPGAAVPAPAAVPPAPQVTKTTRPATAEKRYDDYTPFEEDEEEEIVLDSGTDAGPEFADDGGEDPADELVLEGSDEEPGDEELILEDDAAPGGDSNEAAGLEVSGELQADAPAADQADDESLLEEEELQLESGGDEDSDVPEAALEFTAADLTKVFVEAPAVPLTRPLPADAGDETAEHEILDVEMEAPATPEVITLEGDTVVVVDGGPDAQPAPAAQTPGEAAVKRRKPPTQEAIDLEVRREIEKAFAADPTTRAEFILPSGRKVSLHRNQGEVEVEEIEAADELERDTSRQRRTRIAWGVGGVVLALLLAIQVIHYNRQALAQAASIGPLITSVYGAFGSELTPAWKVDAYDVRQWGAAADPRTGTVKVRASVTNGAEHAQPYPLLRLTLMNRFGERLRQSDIEPKDYLTQAPDAGQLLGAGQRVDASIAIVDPGDEAVNFEIDVCLRRNAAVTCASDAVRQRS